MRWLSMVGARPNFMKIAPIVDELKKYANIEHCLVHSGQHYDELLSGNFFADLGLPKPDVNLEVGSSTHAVQTADVMKNLEPVLLDFKPDLVLVVGDVNSTMAAAITAVKLSIPVAHIEAGLRSFDNTMPEEINRKVTDAISDLLFVTEQSGIDNLKREGVPAEKIFFVGNVMIDSLLRHKEIAARSPIVDRLTRQLGLSKNGHDSASYGVLTLHRPANVDDANILQGILEAVSALAGELPILFPVHPRTRKNIERFGLSGFLGDTQTGKRLIPLDPLGYIDFLAVNTNARIALTDSGGIQEETTVLGIPCLTLRDNTERPVTITHGTNQLVGTKPERILAAARSILQQPMPKPMRPPLWDGQAASRIVAIIRNRLQDS
jgi:UDP-N-acetylglucosamine 2-epimerase (non-hydrolysing)